MTLPFRLDGLLHSAPTPLLILMGIALALLLMTGAAALAALAIHGLDKWRDRRRRREEATWRPRLHEVLTGDAPPSALLDHVPPLRYDAFLSFLTPYAETIEGDTRSRLHALARPFLPVVRTQARSGPPMRRAQALRRLSLFDGSRCAPLLRTLLREDDPSPLILRSAMRELGQVGTAADAALILDNLDRLANTDRRQLSSILYELGEKAAPPLRHALANEPLTSRRRSSFVRVVCAEALRWLADAPSGPIAAALLRASPPPDPEVTASLLRLLRRVGRDRHAAAVRPFCRSETSFVRIHAARALGRLGTGADVPLLHTMRHDDNRWVALSATNALAELETSDRLSRPQDPDPPRTSVTPALMPSTE